MTIKITSKNVNSKQRVLFQLFFFFLAVPETTIALAIVHQLIGLIPDETVQQLLTVIVEALTQEDFDYWGEVKDEVMSLVGQYINEHNMNQVEVYQEDLVTLIDRSASDDCRCHGFR